MSGKYGSTASQTEVPRRTLIAALEKESNLLSTQSLKKTGLQWVKKFEF